MEDAELINENEQINQWEFCVYILTILTYTHTEYTT